MALAISLVHPAHLAPVQTWLFEADSSIRIGRAVDNQVVLYSRVVSRYHLLLEHLGNEWKIINLSTNGTYLDERRITEFCLKKAAVLSLAHSGPKLRIQPLLPSIESEIPLAESPPATYLATLLARRQVQR